ncbi:hypothetical protein FNV43_RR03546 [Rhamnella rubrinervis]|uniref:DUF7876 domain-containing protein n=1 Tax=Rhamnella rubrinervis TaxID=2594499 RepID=A0A8K0MNZ4_9ROSA|nr:hypothetical protein FNV43_RR03546 [Rhamnella rubrinervis]
MVVKLPILLRQQYHGLNMLMVYAPGANTKYRTYPDSNTLHEASPTKITHVNSLSSVTFCPSLIRTCNYALHSCSISWKGRFLPNTHHVPHLVASKKWLCRLHDSISSDDEYRSSRNIAISLFRRYRNEFISAGVNAYALGCTDEGLRKELNDMKESGLEVEAMQSYGGSTSLKSRIASEEVDECILWLSILFITILCTPQPTVVRWSSTPRCQMK